MPAHARAPGRSPAAKPIATGMTAPTTAAIGEATATTVVAIAV